jgi:hypothetical protein
VSTFVEAVFSIGDLGCLPRWFLLVFGHSCRGVGCSRLLQHRLGGFSLLVVSLGRRRLRGCVLPLEPGQATPWKSNSLLAREFGGAWHLTHRISGPGQPLITP